MSIKRVAYLPLITYPDSPPDDVVSAAADLAQALGLGLHATAFAADIPDMPMPMGGFLLSVPDLVRATEQRSLARCEALRTLLLDRASTGLPTRCTIRTLGYGVTQDTAAVEARTFDVALLPWSKEATATHDLAEAVVFGAGRPVVLVPAQPRLQAVRDVAVAWDGSRVAARALADVLALLRHDARITVLTVTGEKALDDETAGERLAASLQERGLEARARSVPLQDRPTGLALQEAAIEMEAGLLAMGGFGHSRLRDFVLGGATQGVFSDLRLPVLMSH